MIPNYNLFRCDRDNGTGRRGGGGICIYTHRRYNVEFLLTCKDSNTDLECQWACFHLKDTRKTYIGNIYRPPPSNGNVRPALEHIEGKLYDLLSENNPDVVMMGDLNINQIKGNDANTRKEQSLCKKFRLSQLIKSPLELSTPLGHL